MKLWRVRGAWRVTVDGPRHRSRYYDRRLRRVLAYGWRSRRLSS